MDQTVLRLIQSVIGVSIGIDAVGIFCASALIWVMAAAVVVFFLVDRRRNLLAAASAFVAAGVAWLVNQGIGELFFRPRPFAALSDVHLLINKSSLEKSFPSDHAAASFALAMAVFMVDRRWGTVMFVAAALVSFGRIFVGVHYPSDIIAGAAIGAICAFAVHCSVHRFLRTKHRPAV